MAVPPAELDTPAVMQTLIDDTMSQAMTKALMSAMGLMSDSISQTLTHALIQAQKSAQPTSAQIVPVTTPLQPQTGRKALAKMKHSSMPQMDSHAPVTDGASIQPRKRATSRAKSARLWKRARAQVDSESDLSDIEEEASVDSEDPSDPDSDCPAGDYGHSQDYSPLQHKGM
ncbi:Hypothetical predicted protein [Pelobates cultripes]|uniref:Uncharacterized protein n=1 Tax=Pelobates cultripes TaxID=61616 RepID=A0AAD1SVL3_PELCU|nr:Hypothetical predicted protein [Pelobates cultripes]